MLLPRWQAKDMVQIIGHMAAKQRTDIYNAELHATSWPNQGEDRKEKGYAQKQSLET